MFLVASGLVHVVGTLRVYVEPQFIVHPVLFVMLDIFGAEFALEVAQLGERLVFPVFGHFHLLHVFLPLES